MSATAILAGLLLAQANPTLTVEGSPSAAEQIDVAYDELVEGRNQEALVLLSRHSEPRHPAVRINLGTAYARLGQHDLALRSYRRAAGSHERYYLMTAEGKWIDSHNAAKLAIVGLSTGKLLAFK